MPRYAYTAIESVTRRERRGTVDSNTPEAASCLLRARGLEPKALRPALVAVAASPGPRTPVVGRIPGLRLSLPIGRAVPATRLAVFTRQLAMLLRAGMPLLRALETLGRQERNDALRRALGELTAHIRSGGTLAEGLRRHPRIFDRLYVNMVKAGEAGGALEVVLDRVAQFHEKAVRLHGRIKAALAYPLVIVCVATGIVAALMVFVVPKFQQIFAGTLRGQPLPALTQAVLAVAGLVRDHALAQVGALLAVVAAGWWLGRTRVGLRGLDRLRLAVPWFGDLMLKAAVARFARTLGTLLSSGVPILPALQLTRETTGNVHLAEAIGRVHDQVKAGEGLAGPLRAAGVFPELVPGMVEVGEETGTLPGMLGRIADCHDEEVDNAVAALTSIMEPVMIVVMALVVGTIVIALFLPIVRVVQGLG